MTETQRPTSVVCPPRLDYPEPPDPVRVLFVSWNPPGPKHFWNSETDKLRTHLRWVLEELRWTTGPDFIGDFLGRGGFLVHAVKCWQHRDGPPPEAVARCARAALLGDLLRLQPERLCLLGSVPHEAASLIVEGLPPVVFSYLDGWRGNVTMPSGHRPRRVAALITVLPDQWNRQHTLRALHGWLP